jgi:Tfp pilus assembly PilM family ATPase
MARFLAIDWDQNQLHLAEANISGTTVKILRAVVSQEEGSPFTGDSEALGKLLKERLKSAGIAAAPVLACVGRDRVIQKDLRFPSVPAHEEPALVRFQAMKEMSEAPEDVVIDFTSMRDGVDKGETRALAMIVRRDILESIQKVCTAAGLKLAGLTPRPLGLTACLRRIIGTTALTPPPEPADGAVAIVTAAEKWAEFCVVRGPQLLLARSLTAGPNLAGEVRRNLAVHAGQNPQHPVCAVYLAGNNIAAVREKLTDMIEAPIYSFDPFAGAERPELPISHRGSFAGAVGLCYARAEKGGLPINFVAPKQPKPPADPRKRKTVLVAALAAVVVAGLYVVANSLQAEETKKLVTARLKASDLETELKKKSEELTRLKNIDDWNGVVWLDELYNVEAAISNVDALRVTQLTAEPNTVNTKGPVKYVGKIIIKCSLVDRNGDTAPLDALVRNLSNDRHYSVEITSRQGRNYTLTVKVAKRAPVDQRSKIKAPGL